MKYVVDLSYYINHRGLSNFYTVREIIEEAIRANIYDFEARAILKSVPKEYVDHVRSIARKIGILDYLSKGDLKLCALAYYFIKNGEDVIVLSNDFYVQNLCFFLSVPFDGDKKIKYAKIFEYVCEHCGTRGQDVICPKCGRVRKRVVKKTVKIEK